MSTFTRRKVLPKIIVSWQACLEKLLKVFCTVKKLKCWCWKKVILFIWWDLCLQHIWKHWSRRYSPNGFPFVPFDDTRVSRPTLQELQRYRKLDRFLAKGQYYYRVGLHALPGRGDWQTSDLIRRQRTYILRNETNNVIPQLCSPKAQILFMNPNWNILKAHAYEWYSSQVLLINQLFEVQFIFNKSI